MEQLTQEQAIAMAESKVWETWTDEQIVRFQLFQDRLCMNIDRYKKALNNVLGRPVYSHELGNDEALILEYLGEKPAPTMKEIIEMIPAEKRIVIGI